MKKHWKLLTTSLIVSLSLASFQASYGIERPTEEDTSFGVTMSVATPSGAPVMEQESNGMNDAVVEPLQTLRCTPSEAREPADTSVHPVNDLKRNHFPKNIGLLILKRAVMGLCCKFNNANKFANVSKGWLAFIKGERPDASKEYAFHFSKDVLEEYTPKTFEECCQLQVFLDGRFVFLSHKPAGRVEFPIASFPNPFRVSLDLFAHLNPYHLGLEIGTGSREVNENVGQHQYAACVNVIPSFWIKRELENGRAAYLRNMYMNQDGSWKPNALIGFYLTRKCDSLDGFVGVTTESCKFLFSKSFGQLFVNRDQGAWEYNKNVAIFGRRGNDADGLLRNGVCEDIGNLYFHF